MNTIRRGLLLACISLFATSLFAADVTLTITRPSGDGYIKSSNTTGWNVSCGTVASGMNSCSAVIPSGTRVHFLAIPNSGKRWVSWGGACQGATTAQCSFVASADSTVVAHFATPGTY